VTSAAESEVVAWLAAALALVAAALFALASAVQQRSAAAVPDEHARGTRLVRSLLRSRLWWTGTLADAGGCVAQAAALGVGSLLLVQPLLVTTVLFALPLGARWAGRRLRRADWGWAALLAVALAAFVVTGDPTAGVDRAGWRQWLPALVVLGVVCAACLLAAVVRRGTSRAVLLALATGLLYGLAAALTKGVVDLFPEGPAAVLTHWTTYLLAVSLLAGTVAQQSAYQAGPLEASLPAATVGEPVVAATLGVTVLAERLQAGGAEWLLVSVLLAAMVAATVALSRSSAAPSAAG
jgi:drug/metabolite transporter (DMT)-like permease